MCLSSNPSAALTHRYLDAGSRRDAYSFLEHRGDERNRIPEYDYDDDDSLPELIEVGDITEPIPSRRPRVRVNMAIDNIPYVLLQQVVRIQWWTRKADGWASWPFNRYPDADDFVSKDKSFYPLRIPVS